MKTLPILKPISNARFTLIARRASLITAAALTVLSLSPRARAEGVVTTFDRNIPEECRDKLQAFTDAGHRILCVAFPPEGGNRWSIVTDQTFFNRNIPQECHERMVQFHQAGQRILCVAFPPEGGNRWSILTDQSFFNRNIPQECHDQMIAFAEANQRPVWVAFPPAGGNRWSLVTDKGTFFNRNIPQECHEKMISHKEAGHRIRCVAFPEQGGNRWSLVTDKGFFNRGVPSECHRVMRAMMRCPGGPLQNVAFDGDGSGFVVISEADPKGLPALVVDGHELLSLDTFAKNLEAQFAGNTVKYAFVIRYGSAQRSAAGGWKRTAATPPAQEFSIYDRFNPASVSKTVTAVALLHALEANGLSIHHAIHPYLPSSWTIPNSVKTITFKELLGHRSGLRNSTYGSGYDTYAGLKSTIEQGIDPADKVYDYENINYALARILVAHLDGHEEFWFMDQAAATAQRFNAYLQKHLLDPLGIPGVAFKADAVEPTLFYPNPPASSTGTAYGDWTLKAGGAGIHLSIAELSIFLDGLDKPGLILSASMRQQMDTHFLGWDKTVSTTHGSYHTKGGFFPGSMNGGAELRSAVADFANGLQVTAVYNGYALPGDLGIGGAIKQAYEASWKPFPKFDFKMPVAKPSHPITLSVFGKSGFVYKIQKSTNLKDWTTVETIEGADEKIEATPPVARASMTLYRFVVEPAPKRTDLSELLGNARFDAPNWILPDPIGPVIDRDDPVREIRDVEGVLLGR